jgi:phosphoglycerate dehydrogenase-like enzyme
LLGSNLSLSAPSVSLWDGSNSAHDGATPASAPRVAPAIIGVVGLGYVGLAVAVSFAEAGFRVVGVAKTRSRVRAVGAGH